MKDQEKICREEWFKDHKAERIVHYQCGEKGDAIIIEWKKPGSWNYGCRFIIHSQWLCVVGDLGEAVYQWSESITMAFLVSLNFDYFAGKCRASDSGNKFRTWDENKAFDETRKFLAELDAADPPDVHHEDFRRCLRRIMKCTGKDEFDAELRVAHDEGLQTEDASYLSECGFIPSPMCVGHFVGLQMAIKQLTNPAVTVTPTP